jgi:hypothetical protein
VRLAAGGGFCILADPNDPQSGTLFGLRYNIAESPMPDEEKVFGDVEIGAGMGLFHTGEMSGSDMTCDDVPEQGEVRVDTIHGSCSASGSCTTISVARNCEVTVQANCPTCSCPGKVTVFCDGNQIAYLSCATRSDGQQVCNSSCQPYTRYKCDRTGTVYNDNSSCTQACQQSTCTLPGGFAPNGQTFTNKDTCDAACKYQQMVCLENNKIIQSQAECVSFRQDCYAGCATVDNGDGTTSRECSSSCGTQSVEGVEKKICTGTCEDTSYNEGTRTDTIQGTCSTSGSCTATSVARYCELKWASCSSSGSLLVTAKCDGTYIYSKCGARVSDGQNACNTQCAPYTRYTCNRTGTVYNDNSSCTQACQQSTCSLPGGIAPHGQVYANSTVCNSQCFRQELHCAQSNKLVQSAAECGVPRFECSIDLSTYSTQAACAQSCSFEPGGAIQYGSCAKEGEEEPEDQIKFSLWLSPSSADFGLDAKLSYVEPGSGADAGSGSGSGSGAGSLPDNETLIAQTAYGNESALLNQCAVRYVNPFIYFDEPGTFAHFEFDHMDQFIYRTAVTQGLLPAEEGKNVLPYIPPVYAGSKARMLDQAYLNQAQDADAETGMLPPLPENMQELAKDAEAQVPKRPMFWGKTIGTEYVPDTTTRLGKYAVTAGNLLPRVYYYECPDTYKVKSDTNTCMGQDPFGGVAPTIAGNFCFQYFCDASAITEDNPTQISGCGMVNDGRWE